MARSGKFTAADLPTFSLASPSVVLQKSVPERYNRSSQLSVPPAA